MTTATTSIVSMGKACSLIQFMPERIHAAAEALGIQPAMRINGIDHYTEHDLQRIADWLRAKGTKRRGG